MDVRKQKPGVRVRVRVFVCVELNQPSIANTFIHLPIRQTDRQAAETHIGSVTHPYDYANSVPANCVVWCLALRLASLLTTRKA